MAYGHINTDSIGALTEVECRLYLNSNEDKKRPVAGLAPP